MTIVTLVLLALSPIFAVLGFAYGVIAILWIIHFVWRALLAAALIETQAAVAPDGCGLLLMPRVRLALLLAELADYARRLSSWLTAFGCLQLDAIGKFIGVDMNS